jgi:hypothetical protein
MCRSPESRRDEIMGMGFPEQLSRLALPVPFTPWSKAEPFLAGRLSRLARNEYAKEVRR